jgi:hypothetical protein
MPEEGGRYAVEQASLLAYKVSIQEDLEAAGWVRINRPYASSKRSTCWSRGEREINVTGPLDCNDYKDDFKLVIWSSGHGEYSWTPRFSDSDATAGITFCFKPYDLPCTFYETFDKWQAAVLEFIQ